MCRIMTAHPQVIVLCDKPYTLSYFTISFRSFSPTPGALEFHAGKDYYFISTSSKDDLYLRSGGMCRTHNMKLVFKVADGSKKSETLTNNKLKDNHSAPPSHENIVEEHQEKKERRRKRKKERRNHKTSKNSVVPSSDEENITAAPSHGLSELMNDNPKFRQKEPSQVEKVNNLMKQEASIFAGGGSEGLRVNFLLLLAISFLFH